MVPAEWGQLPRMPRVSAIKIWRKNNFTPDSSPLTPLLLDLSPLDFSFCVQAMAHFIRCERSTIAELKAAVEDFAVNMSEEEVRKKARNTRKRAELCRDNFGEHFEH